MYVIARRTPAPATSPAPRRRGCFPGFLRGLSDLHDPGVAIEALDPVLREVAVAAHQLDGLVGDLALSPDRTVRSRLESGSRRRPEPCEEALFHPIRTLGAVALLLLVAPSLPGSAEETPYSQLYFRNIRGKPSAVSILRARAMVRRCDAVLVVLDTATFDPPPGVSEFNLDNSFQPDVAGWLDALAAWPGGKKDEDGPGSHIPDIPSWDGAAIYLELVGTEDMREGVTSFIEKRRPKFQDK